MQSSARHLLLIVGSVLTIFGILMFLFLQERKFKIVGGFLFAAGALLIARAIKNPQQRKNRLPDIRKRYQSEKKSKQSQESDEVH